MFMRKSIIRWRRYSIYIFQYTLERMHGLDFTMRDLTLIKESGGDAWGFQNRRVTCKNDI